MATQAKDLLDNKALRIDNENKVQVSNCGPANVAKEAHIIFGPQNCGKTNTVCYIAQTLRASYGTRQVTAVLNETRQKEILHVAIIDGDVDKCMGFSSKGDDLATALNNTLSLCLSCSRILVIAVRDVARGANAGMVAQVESLCQKFGYGIQRHQLSQTPNSVPANGVNQAVASSIISSIQKLVP